MAGAGPPQQLGWRGENPITGRREAYFSKCVVTTKQSLGMNISSYQDLPCGAGVQWVKCVECWSGTFLQFAESWPELAVIHQQNGKQLLDSTAAMRLCCVQRGWHGW